MTCVKYYVYKIKNCCIKSISVTSMIDEVYGVIFIFNGTAVPVETQS